MVGMGLEILKGRKYDSPLVSRNRNFFKKRNLEETGMCTERT